MIIGLTGPRAAGKTTVADILVEHYGYTKLSFGAPIVAMVRKIVPEGLIQKGRDRVLMQAIGDYYRAYDPDFFVKFAYKAVAEIDGPIVFDDVRYPNEAQMCNIVAKVLSNKALEREVSRDGAKIAPPHESDGLGIYSNFLITNDGTMDELRARVHAVFGRRGTDVPV